MFPDPSPNLKMRFLWLAIGYILVFVVVYQSIAAHPVEVANFPYQDKFFHALAYFSLMAWFAQIYHDKFQRNMIAVIFIFMGMAMEYIQSFEPTRTADIADIAANMTGVGLGFLLSLTMLKNILVNFEKRVIRRRA